MSRRGGGNPLVVVSQAIKVNVTIRLSSHPFSYSQRLQLGQGFGCVMVQNKMWQTRSAGPKRTKTVAWSSSDLPFKDLQGAWERRETS